MSETRPLTYAAVITIDLPGSERLQASVTLLPPDEIATGAFNGGPVVLKPLRDCTLADLCRFAENLEAEIWETYADSTLAEFLQKQTGEVEIRVIQQPGDPPADVEGWWEGAALVIEEGAGPAGRSEAEIDSLLEEAAAIDPGPVVAASSDPETVDAPPVEGDLDLRIVVAEPEPLIEEREVDASEPVHVIDRRDMENRLAGYRLPLDDPTPAAVDILFDEQPFRAAQRHALGSLNREVAGMLVGPPPEKQPNGRYVVHVTDTIEARHTRMQGASVTYTPESWRYVNDVLLERYPDEACVIVGWYHTHPGFGIFLSNMDLFIHHNFFIQKWHIALVLDPIALRCGFFTWNRAQSEVMAYHFPWPYWAHAAW